MGLFCLTGFISGLGTCRVLSSWETVSGSGPIGECSSTPAEFHEREEIRAEDYRESVRLTLPRESTRVAEMIKLTACNTNLDARPARFFLKTYFLFFLVFEYALFKRFKDQPKKMRSLAHTK